MNIFKRIINKIKERRRKKNSQEPEPVLPEIKLYSPAAGKKSPGEKIEPVEAEGALKSVLEKMLEREVFAKLADTCLFFDPEEDACYIYILKDERLTEADFLSLEDWKEVLSGLKSINGKHLKVKDEISSVNISIFLTNLGERAGILFLDPADSDLEIIKELKKKITRLINQQKPATGLTHKNVENLMNIISSREGKTEGDIYEIFVRREMITPQMAECYKSGGDLRDLLFTPASRKQIVNALAEWLQVEYFDAELSDTDEALALTVPKETAFKYKALPKVKNPEGIKVCFTNPFDAAAVSAIQECFQDRVIPAIACEEDIRNELEELYEEN